MQKTCLIIPFYNEEKRFPVAEFSEYFNASEKFYFCFVNDSSKDKTREMLIALSKGRENRIMMVDLPRNEGKASAVRIGINKALRWQEFSYVGYLDADFSAPLDQMELLQEKISSNRNYEFVFGSRVKLLGKKIERKAVRHYFGRIFSTIASLILKTPVYDTQCGAKIFTSGLAAKVFEERFMTSWLFDIEIFARIIKEKGKVAAIKAMAEVPLEVWIHKGNSRLNLISLIKTPWDLLRIYLRYRKFL